MKNCGVTMTDISLEPTGVCKRCDNLIMYPEARFVKGKLGTHMVDAPYCKIRKLHYDYIRKIDEGKRDCRYYVKDGIT